MKFFLIDYYFLYLIVLSILSIMLINFKKLYFTFKINKICQFNDVFKLTMNNLLFLILKIGLFFILISIFFNISFTEIDPVFLHVRYNIIICSKIYIYIFCYFFLILYEYYAFLLKWLIPEHLILFFFSVFALTIIAQANNFINFYIILEIYSLSIVSAIILKKFNKKLVESTFKYLVINIVSSCFLLFGISIIFAFTGFLDFYNLKLYFFISNSFNDPHFNFLCYGLFLFFFGFIIKLVLFPFSLWFVNIYYNLPIPYVFFLLVFPKFIFLTVLINLSFFIFGNYSNNFFLLIFFLSIMMSVVHNFLAVYQNKFKNLIVNLSFANAPFFFLPLFFKSSFFLVGFFNFFLIYFFNLFCFFLILLVFYSKNFLILHKKLVSLVGLFYINKYLTFLVVVNFLSLSAIPPFSGFFAKFYIFLFLTNSGSIYLYFILAFLNLLVVYCYLRIIRLFFLKKSNLSLKIINIKKKIYLLILIFLSFVNIFFVFVFDFLFQLNTLFLIFFHYPFC